MPIFHDQESYDRWVEEELPKIAQRFHEDPSTGISQEQMDEIIAEWDREDGLAPEELKRSA